MPNDEFEYYASVFFINNIHKTKEYAKGNLVGMSQLGYL